MKLFDPEFIIKAIPQLLEQVPLTLAAAAAAVLIGGLLGTIFAYVNSERIPVLYQILRVFISFTRGTPLVSQLFICLFAIPVLLSLFGMKDTRSVPMLVYAIVPMSLHLSGYMAETLRGSLTSIGKEQLEAAVSVGMRTHQAYLRILFPQAFAYALPDISSLIITTLKDTSLLFNVGLIDIMTKAKMLGAVNARNLEVYIAVAVIYIALCLILNLFFSFLEKRIRQNQLGQ